MKVHVTYDGPRCVVTDIGEDALELTVKDCSHLGEGKAQAKQTELMNMFLQVIHANFHAIFTLFQRHFDAV